MYNVSEDVDNYADSTTTVLREVAEAATVAAASPGRLLSVHYPFALGELSSTSPAVATAATTTTTTSTATATIDYAVRNVSVALCHPSTGIPSVDEYFTGK